MVNAYGHSDEILGPKEFVHFLVELHMLSQELGISAGSRRVEIAGKYHRLHNKIIDSYINMWAKSESAGKEYC